MRDPEGVLIKVFAIIVIVVLALAGYKADKSLGKHGYVTRNCYCNQK